MSYQGSGWNVVSTVQSGPRVVTVHEVAPACCAMSDAAADTFQVVANVASSRRKRRCCAAMS